RRVLHLSFLFSPTVHHRDLHPFPTRRSSDLPQTEDQRARDEHIENVDEAEDIHGRPHVSRAAQRRAADQAIAEEHVAEGVDPEKDRKSTRLNSSHRTISYAVFCLKKKKDTYI